MATDRVLRIDIPQHPSPAVEVQHRGPPVRWRLTLGREDADLDLPFLPGICLRPRNQEILNLADLEDGPAPRDQDAAGPRRLDGLVVHLLLVDDVLVVEGDVFRVEFVLDGGVEGVGRLGGLRFRFYLCRHDVPELNQIDLNR